MRIMMVIGTIVVRIISLRLAKIYTFINIRTVCSINKNKIIRIKRSSQGGNHVENNPYRVPIGQGEWTCSIAVLLGTHTGPMMGLHGTLMVGIFSKTDAGPSSKMIQDEKYIRGIIPEVEEEMLEQGK